MISLLTSLSRDPGIREEATGRFFHKNKGFSTERSPPLLLEHASKTSKSVPPSSTQYLRENDEDPQEALQRHDNVTSSKRTPARHTR